MKCIVDSCSKDKKYAIGYCPMHYQRSKKGIDLNKEPKVKNKGKTCLNPECFKEPRSRGFCKNCGRKQDKFGDPNVGKKKGKYRKKSRDDGRGYVIQYDPTSIHADAAGRVAEHRKVMGDAIGRRLFDHENVHHKNGIRSDNRLENLELWSKAQPPGQRVEDKIEFYIHFLEQYGYEVKKA